MEGLKAFVECVLDGFTGALGVEDVFAVFDVDDAGHNFPLGVMGVADEAYVSYKGRGKVFVEAIELFVDHVLVCFRQFEVGQLKIVLHSDQFLRVICLVCRLVDSFAKHFFNLNADAGAEGGCAEAKGVALHVFTCQRRSGKELA